MVEEVSGAGNTRQPRHSASKYWCFTYNNYEAGTIIELVEKFKVFDLLYIFGEEVGESGTPHLQGYIEGKEEFRPMETLKLSKKIHWEKRKGSKAQNIKYCSKEGNFHTNFPNVRKPPKVPNIYGWQLDGLAHIISEPDDRSVLWFWSEYGGIGKSSLVKYLAMKHDAIICSGKASDMKYMVVKYIEKHGHGPGIIIFDVPRSSHQYISYTGIEELKNGCFFSSKYECEQVIIDYPQVVVFSNFPPDMNNEDLSVDRLKVWNVDRGVMTHMDNGNYNQGGSKAPEESSTSSQRRMAAFPISNSENSSEIESLIDVFF